MINSRLKLARTREHLDKLNKEMRIFIQDNAPNVDADLTKNGAYLAIVHLPTPPIRIGVIAADVFQNLRASLDYLAWELALLNEDSPDDNTAFPICRNWNKNSQKRFNQNTKNITQDAINEIQALQPYHRGNSYMNHPLWVINSFCNVAKHRSIPIVGTKIDVTNPTSYRVIDTNTVELLFNNPPMGFKPDANWTISFFSGIREYKGITLLPNEISDLYNFVVEVVIPKFTHFFR
jgi:hypothetical protein